MLCTIQKTDVKPVRTRNVRYMGTRTTKPTRETSRRRGGGRANIRRTNCPPFLQAQERGRLTRTIRHPCGLPAVLRVAERGWSIVAFSHSGPRNALLGAGWAWGRALFYYILVFCWFVVHNLKGGYTAWVRCGCADDLAMPSCTALPCMRAAWARRSCERDIAGGCM